MKVFVSSTITGFEPMRTAARAAVTTLRYEPIMAEDFGAQPNSPQIACLAGLRQADLVVLVLGEKYGSVQPGSGLSPTHEEYREAQGRRPVIAFVQDGITPEPHQAAFIAEVRGWEGGLVRNTFRDHADLQIKITQALHDHDLANAVGPLDRDALVQRAISLLPRTSRSSHSALATEPNLCLSVVGGPLQQMLRPVQLEAEALADSLHQEALFGQARIFDRSKGVQKTIEQDTLVLDQERGAQVRLNEQGSVLLRMPLEEQATNRDRYNAHLPAIIEEVVRRQFSNAVSYAASLFERIDPTQRLTHVAVAALIDGAEHLTWRTQAEHDANPRSAQMNLASSQDRSAVHVSHPRAALRLDVTNLVEDLLVPLRRQWKPR